ncbi:3-oxoacyl-ACP reductase family protein [Edaphobacter sp. 12200R-103]|jgi:3-oxoacyl-[acyl-carrier protein] reductase|uniref:3-oxoacyl-ACP reductase family protein n=1 Tax=Edaphobacter sp. 12200R-103 TaxID=2703788 RepID=UPI00138C37FA|nr:3-oxoacyl-ACP reductase family protein [Edaphobacter sp. 12200R-103]QHS52263.1 3-oxoacyl-ACP reductase FabG [Edaphobacter sp. 12200R-103]
MESSALPLIGKTALVTGASRGIGSAAALSLARAGCDVAVNYVRSQQEALAVVRSIEQLGRRALAVQADVSAPTDVERMMKTIHAGLGEVHILVNNAGINPTKPFLELDLADWNHTLATNLTSAFLVSQAVLPAMRNRQWGRLIFISSVAAQTGGVVGPHYAASKAGMHGLMHSYANLLAKEGITSNAIAPALVETEMIRNNRKIRPDLIPVGRFGHAEEVAAAVTFLATISYITGQTINLNGGWYMS